MAPAFIGAAVGAAEAVIATWYFEDGDDVEKDAVLVDIMIEKVSLELTAPRSGKLTIKKQAEVLLIEGDIIGTIE